MADTSDAMVIYQAHLDRVSRAFWDRDWEEVANNLSLPSWTRTLDTEIYTVDRDAQIGSQMDLRDSFARVGATEYHRICLEAAFQDETQQVIVGRHRTHVLLGGSYVMDPYENDMRVRFEDGRWKAFDLLSHIGNSQLTVTGLRSKRVTPPPDRSDGGAGA